MSQHQNININKNQNLKRVLLSGGGTGGHIYPALAVAQEFKNQFPNIDIRFVGSERGLESKIIPDKGYKLYKLNIGPLHSSVGRLEQIKTLFSLPFVFLHCLWILILFRPQRVVGFGGYASGPIVFMASILFIPTAIWEANVQPGIANKMLSRFVKRCFVVFENSLKYFPANKTVCLGYPVRAEFDELYALNSNLVSTVIPMTSLKSTIVSSSAKNLDIPSGESKLKVLIFGGSQGAQIFNQVIPKVVNQFPNLEFNLQTGMKNFEATIKSVGKLPVNLKIYPFLDPILNFYLNSDLIICRSGAGAVAELSSIGVNCLFVPFALASDNHQYKNAVALSDQRAAYLIEEKNFNEASIAQFLNDFQAKSNSSDGQTNRQMKQRMLGFFKPKATQNIVENLVKL